MVAACVALCVQAADAHATSSPNPAASPSPTPTAAPSPTASPAPAVGIRFSGDGFASFVNEAFAGPGLINLDVSVSRTFPLAWLGDKGSLILRADAFNFLNHPNLNPPGNIPGSPNYGIALFGTPPQTTGFPSVVPLAPAARNIQLMLRVNF